MADTEISDFGNAAALDGTERLAGEQSGNNVNVTPAQIRTYLGSAGIPFSDTLSVYEEGSFSAVLSDGTTTQTLVANECSYVRIGRLFFAQIHVTWGVWAATGASAVRLTGMPYDMTTLAGTIANAEVGVTVGSFNGFDTTATRNQVTAFITGASPATIFFARMNDNAGGSFCLGSEMSNNGGLALTVMYIAE